jgi:hypothetical protein
MSSLIHVALVVQRCHEARNVAESIDGARGIMRFQDEALSASRLGANLELRTRLFMIRVVQSASICDVQETSLHIECKACRN